MHVNGAVDGAFVASSGRNMGAFKGVGFPEEIAHFYRLEEYAGHTWLGHSRFPTNTPGWWGGAHPFTLLDWSVVHNGEISSYGINRRYLEQFGYRCTLGTDTEVAAYLFDLLLRRHGLPLELACKVVASPLWSEIDRLGESDEALLRALRCVYGSAMLNGPFAIVLGFDGRHDGPERPHQAASAGGRPPRLDRHGGLRGERHLRGARDARRDLGAARRRARDRPRGERRERATATAGGRDRRRPTPAACRGGLDAAQHGAARVHGRHRRPALQPLRGLRGAVRLGRLCLRRAPLARRRQVPRLPPLRDVLPDHAITVKESELAYGGNQFWAAPLRRAIWRQAETGGVMLASTGNDGAYPSIFDHLVLDACQITNPSIDPLREPMELRTYLGGQPEAVAVEPDARAGTA